MGYYIETDTATRKADWLVRNLGGEIISKPKRLSDIPQNQALICVVQNVFFDAAGLCYDQSEFEEFTNLTDSRPKTYVLVDKETAYRESGYTR